MKNKPIPYFAITRFINEQTIGGIILIIATIIALYWSNSYFYESYQNLWHNYKIGFVWGDMNMVGSLHHWINDGLMALFFFTVGLEIKREIMGGELNSVKKASLPIAAAVGGMIIPAVMYSIVVFNYPEYISGWGIPMATDIAFALGLMAMFGKRVNINLKIFLTALAIADDLGAVLVIAFFYTDTIVYAEIISAIIFLGVLVIANFAGVRRTVFYAIVGFGGVWVAFMLSGVHATIAGVLIAFTIPARTKIDEDSFMNKLSGFIAAFKKEPSTQNNLLSKKQVHIISEIEKLNDQAHTPLQKLEHALHPVVIYFILPIFALSNAGVHISGSIIDMFLHPISLGIIAGLLLGKFIGISIFSHIVVKFKFATLPEGVTWKQIYGAAFLAGIGFTMSMFISDLAFVSEEFKEIAKVGIIAASALSAIVGMLLLGMSLPKGEK
ncbi:MAG TPA: Na+/H+ antiporter NhaA [Bacteroidales bacterium]|jgi:NhaA family Na+:H+ antiporter|nr:Na+/H+ antiporter NhaA [Bacteroidota bacterium]HJN05742.1 Na+/H+ antiporter NhaA [Bacteroidales bacterium]|tara:strand:+ start:903 stop:2222 length:1320 start_codon:yes stop_codon:yes gene_type:complete